MRASPTYESRASSHVYGRGLCRAAWDSTSGRESELTLFAHEPLGAPAADKPAVLLIHGGGFTDGSAGAMQTLAKEFASRGWVAFTINYRKERDYGSLPACWPPTENVAAEEPALIQWWAAMHEHCWKAKKMYPAARDAKAALRYIHANTQRFGILADAIVAVGNSAGGYLSCMLGLSDPTDFRDEIGINEDQTLLTTHIGARSDVAASVVLAGSPDIMRLLQVRQSGNQRGA